MPTLALILASLASFAWLLFLVDLAPRSPLPVSGRTLTALVIPVGLSLLGLVFERLQRLAGVTLLVFSLVVLLISVWIIGLSYLPSSILLLIRPTWSRIATSPRP
jgi:hypothetical protein